MHQKPWLNHYPQGVPAEIDSHQYNSLVEIFIESCKQHADKPALMNFGSQISFTNLLKQAENFAAYLQQELHIKKGDRVAIMLPNVMQYHVVMFGILMTGAIVVNVNPLYTPREVEHQLLDADVSSIIVLANFAKTLEEVLPKLPLKNIIVTEIGDMLGPVKSKVVNWVVKHIKHMVPAFQLPNVKYLSDVLKRGSQQKYQAVSINVDDIAFLQYTGGTTGLAKGAILSHGNIISNVMQGLTWLNQKVNYGSVIVLTPLPLYHIFSLTICAFCIVKLGGMSVLITNPRDLNHFVKEIKHIDFTFIVGINTLFNALINHPEFVKRDFSNMRLTISGGMTTQKKIADQWQKITGSPIIEGYGLTETSPMVTINSPDIAGFTGSIGMPIPSTDVIILDEKDQELPIGQAGELCVKGPQVMKGYWQKPEETQKVFTPDGWLRTGDIAKMDENGMFYLVDRKKDMIVVSGFNVYPNEIEEVLAAHPAVLEVAVIGVENEKTGEAVKAFVVLRKGMTLTKEDLLDYCKRELTPYKIPKFIEFRQELPKSNVGKILRRMLKEEEVKFKKAI